MHNISIVSKFGAFFVKLLCTTPDFNNCSGVLDLWQCTFIVIPPNLANHKNREKLANSSHINLTCLKHKMLLQSLNLLFSNGVSHHPSVIANVMAVIPLTMLFLQHPAQTSLSFLATLMPEWVQTTRPGKEL